MRIIFLSLFMFLLVAYSNNVSAHNHDKQSAHDDEEVKIEKIDDNFYLVQAGGGNIVTTIGEQGIFMVDDGLEENTKQVMEAIKSLSDKPVKIIANTHWHYDHAGNNEKFGEGQSIIIAHENVRKRLKAGQTIKAFDKVVAPAPLNALPHITYNQPTSIYLNDEEVKIIPMAAAHTDGDSILYWPKKNILHTGDLFFNGFFPFIDASSGGSLDGMLKAIEKVIAMVDKNTKIVPGHGPLASKADLENYYAMLVDISLRLLKARESKMSKEEWIKSDPLADLGTEWGDGFLDVKTFTALVWDVSL